jgi:ATP/maltotriose-dependent transcriptional regulator MalT
VWIRAPGSGRSTLLSQWRRAEQGRRAFAWLALDTSDSDPIRFWIYAVEGCARSRRRPGKGPFRSFGHRGVDLAKEMLPVLVEELGQIGRPWRP